MTIDEAYSAVLRFLEIYRSELHDAAVIDVLSDGALVGVRETADPGAWGMWLQALNATTEDAFARMQSEYRERWKR